MSRRYLKGGKSSKYTIEHPVLDIKLPNNMADYRESASYTAAYPLILSEKILGLYFENDCTTSESDDKRQKKPKCQNNLCARIYSGGVVAILILNLIRFLTAFKVGESFGEQLFLKVIFMVWYLQCFVNSVVCYHACSNRKCLPHFFRQMERIRETRPRMAGSCRRIRQFANLWCLIGWSFVILNTSAFIFVIFKSDFGLDEGTLFLFAPFTEETPPVQVACVVIQIICSTSWVMPIAFFYVICKDLTEAFRVYNRMLEQSVSEDGQLQTANDIGSKDTTCNNGEATIVNDNSTTSTEIAEEAASPGELLERLRLEHGRLCEMVDTLSETFSLFVTSAYLTNIPLNLFIIYILIWPAKAIWFVTVVYVFWLVLINFYMLVVTGSGSALNKQAHAALGTLHRMSALQFKGDEQLQMTMFLQKLSGSAIGISAMDLFVVDKPLLLTLASVILSYFIIIAQTIPGIVSTPDIINSTLQS